MVCRFSGSCLFFLKKILKNTQHIYAAIPFHDSTNEKRKLIPHITSVSECLSRLKFNPYKIFKHIFKNSFSTATLDIHKIVLMKLIMQTNFMHK